VVATIAVVMRCFPGLLPSSYVSISATLQPGAGEGLRRAARSSRQLVAAFAQLDSIDWNMNREIRSVVDQLLSRA